MTRLRRYCPQGIPVHIIQRGNNRNDCFHSSGDKATYYKYLKAASREYSVSVHAWVFMSNHVHLLVTPHSDDSVSRMMQSLGHQYVRFFNRRYRRTGTLWEGRFRSCLVQTEGYFLVCQRYIELNPVRAGLVEHPGDFHWSSYKTNACGVESDLLEPHEAYLSLDKCSEKRFDVYKFLFDEVIAAGQISDIRESVNRGLVFGSPAFKDNIQMLSGQRSRLNKRGRKSAKATKILL